MMGHMGAPRTVPPVPCGTMGRDGHLGQAMYDGTHGSPQDSPSCPMWDNGTGRTLGTSYVRWDTWESLGQSLLSHVGQWDGTDTLCTMGHMGVPRIVPPVPCGTMGRDGHLGQAMYDGTHGSPQDSPSCPMWDNGTGRTLGTSYVRWDTWESPGQSLLSHVGQWDGTDTWDKLCTMGHMGVPRTVLSCPMWDSGMGRTHSTMGHMGVPRTSHPSHRGYTGVHRTSHPSHRGHTDTQRMMGHMGVPRTVCPSLGEQ